MLIALSDDCHVILGALGVCRGRRYPSPFVTARSVFAWDDTSFYDRPVQTLCRDCGHRPRPDARTCSTCDSRVSCCMRKSTASLSPMSTAAPSTPPSRNAIARSGEAELVARYGKIGRRRFMFRRGEDAADLEQLRPILWRLAETVARRTRKASVADRGVMLKLKTSEFRTVTRTRRLHGATRSAEEMFRAAEPLLAREADGRASCLIGIGTHDLVEAEQVAQDDLFGEASRVGGKIERVLDAVREKFGDDAIVRGRGFGVKLKRQGPSKTE